MKNQEYIVDNPVWVDKVRQIEPSDRVLGGSDGPANWQANDLANRTRFLKDASEETNKRVSNSEKDIAKNIENTEVAQKNAEEAKREADKKMLPFKGYLRDEHINSADKEGFYSVSSSAYVSKKNGYPGDLNRTAVVRVYRWGKDVLLQQVVTNETTYSRSYNLKNPDNVLWNKTYTDINTDSIKGFVRDNGSLIPVTEDQITSSLSDNKNLPASIYVVNQVNRDVVTAQKTANTADNKALEAKREAEKRMLPFNGYLRDEHINNADKEGFYSVSSSAYVSKKNGYPGDLNRTAVVRVYRWGTDVLLQQVVTDESTYSRFYNLKAPNSLTWNKTYTDTNTTVDLESGFVRAYGEKSALTTDKVSSDLTSNRPDYAISEEAAYTLNNKASEAKKEAEKRLLPFNGYLRDEHINSANKEGFYSTLGAGFVTIENGYPADLNSVGVIRVSRWGVRLLLQEIITENARYTRRYDLDKPLDIKWETSRLNEVLKARNGWWKCGDTGLIKQWGTANTDLIVNFPIAFPVTCTNLSISLISAEPKYADSVFISTTDHLGFSYQTVTPEAIKRTSRIYWTAIGY